MPIVTVIFHFFFSFFFLEIAYLHMHVKFGLPFVRVIAVTGYVSQITYLLMMDAMRVRPAVLIKVMAFMGILTTALNVAKFFATTDPVSGLQV